MKSSPASARLANAARSYNGVLSCRRNVGFQEQPEPVARWHRQALPHLRLRPQHVAVRRVPQLRRAGHSPLRLHQPHGRAAPWLLHNRADAARAGGTDDYGLCGT